MPSLETLLNDPGSYIHHVADPEVISHALETGGKNTAVRFCFGATDQAPFRALGYVVAAASMVEQLPDCQVQFVFTPNTGERVNGIPQEKSIETIETIREVARLSVLVYFADLRKDQVTFLRDTTEELPADIISQMQKAIADHPAEERLAASARRRGTDHIAYLAAHVLMQYMHGTVYPLDGEPQPLDEPALIINGGSFSDIPFHELIEESRNKGLIIPDIARTVQLTTRHRLPPYITCKEGEPDILEYPIHNNHRNSDVKRALRHIKDTVRNQAELRSRLLYAQS